MHIPKLSLLELLLLIMVLVSSCKKEGSQTENSTYEDLPRELSTVVVRQEAEPPTLMPLLTTSGYATEVMYYLFQPLMDYDPRTMKYVGVLAEDEYSAKRIETGKFAGGMRYTFTLRPEAQWSDGSAVTVSDYVFTLKMIGNPALQTVYKSYLNAIQEVVINKENPRNFSVVVYPYYLNAIDITSNFQLLPKHIYDPSGVLDRFSLQELRNLKPDHPHQEELSAYAELLNSEKYARDSAFVQGSGPYELESWQTGQFLQLRKKAPWWGDALADQHPIFQAQPERIRYRPIQDIPATVAAIKSQELDVAVLAPDREMVEARNHELILEHYHTFPIKIRELYWISINTKSPKLSDRRVRRALAHLTDVDQILNDLAMGSGERIRSPYHPTEDAFSDQLPFIEFSTDKAAALLEEAGWVDTDGDGIRDKVIDGVKTPLSLSFLVSSSSQVGKPTGLILKERAAKVGIAIQMVYKEINLIFEDYRKRDFELAVGGTRRSNTSFDPYQRYHSDSDRPGGNNIFGFGTPQSDSLINLIRFGDPVQREDAYRSLEETIYEEQPAIYLYTPYRTLFVHKRLKAWPSDARPGYFPGQFGFAHK